MCSTLRYGNVLLLPVIIVRLARRVQTLLSEAPLPDSFCCRRRLTDIVCWEGTSSTLRFAAPGTLHLSSLRGQVRTQTLPAYDDVTFGGSRRHRISSSSALQAPAADALRRRKTREERGVATPESTPAPRRQPEDMHQWILVFTFSF